MPRCRKLLDKIHRAPIPNGLIWCAAIEACQEIGAFERVGEWTAALYVFRLLELGH